MAGARGHHEMEAAHPDLAGGRLTIDLAALVANYRLLAGKSAPAVAAGVVKANAYGLGLDAVVPALLAAGCTRFFTALPEEGLAVRRLAPSAQIFVLAGLFGKTAAAAHAEAGLVPVLNSLDDIALWREFCHERAAALPSAIHVDTGMNRLGLTLAEALFLDEPAGLGPVLLMSHLASADDPDSPKNREQLESFQRVRAAFGGIEASLANSAGIFLGPDYAFDLTRPGIALYGGAPVNGAANPMLPVATAEARIVQIRNAKAGETASYGGTARLEQDTVIAVAAVGYADGLHRALSGAGVPLRRTEPAGGHGFVAGKRVPVIGRITMDLTLFDVTELGRDEVRPGDWIELFGKNIPIDDAARAAGTISYELLTSLGRRYERRYLEANENDRG